MNRSEDALARAERRVEETAVALMAQSALVAVFRRQGHRLAAAEARSTLEALQTALTLAQLCARAERRARGLSD